MKIYNTLTGKKQEFIPNEEGKVKMYACGITVSGEAHIGHAYQALIYDIIRKYLEKKGYDVTYARNYTDVDDKIIVKSNETGIPADVYAKQMIENIDAQMARLAVDDPNVWIMATDCIDDIIAFVKTLIEKGHAYPTDKGDVYFSVESFNSYGKLSHRNLEDALNGVRVSNDEEKKNPLDFALWKSAKEGEPSWPSPWGEGRPGWHIECSAMNYKTFGESIDIHGGGRDLIFPHHENEIAQTEALTGKPFASYWIHNGLIKVNGQKMSKSLGNSLFLKDLLDKYDKEVIKLALLQTNYRGDINVTDNLFPDAEKHLYDFYKVFNGAVEKGIEIAGEYPEIDAEFNKCMDDDFNTALAISNLYGYFKKARAMLNNGDQTVGAYLNQIKSTYNLLGLFTADAKAFIKSYEEKTAVSAESFPAEVVALADKRLQAKQAKDWATADALRAEISALGYEVKDGKDCYTLIKK
ncbi:MAG: cysteine--tRNA ligase [Clostridia bacterium]|nr:cysteine--tRNA ligase [Clostridia bacterium]